MNKTPDGFQEWKGIASSPVAVEGFQEWNGGALQKHEQSPSPISAPSQPRANPPASVDEFVQQITPIAQRIAQKIGAPVDAVIGQLGLETGWGKSVIPGTNNYGNIKDTSGKGVAATDSMTGSRDRYRQYASAEEFADDYAKLVGTNPRYKGAVGAKDAQGFFTGLKQGGYAEDPNYVQSGVAASRTAAESLKRSGKATTTQQSAALPDMNGIPKWSEIATKDKYAKLPDAEKVRMKNAYFDELIAPYVSADGLDVSAEKAKFMNTSFDAKPESGMLDSIKNAGKDALGAIAAGGNQLIGAANFVSRYTPAGIADNVVSRLAGKESGNDILARKMEEDRQTIASAQSPEMQQQRSNIDAAKGFKDTMVALWDNPRAVANFVGEQLPQFGLMGKVGKAAMAGKTGVEAVVAATTANQILSGVMSAADAGTSAEQAMYAYVKQQGGSEQEARDKASAARSVAGAVGGVLGTAIGRIGASAESGILARALGHGAEKLTVKQAAQKVPTLIAKEFTEESLDEGLASQMASNLGEMAAGNKQRGVMDDVAKSAAIGGTLGLVMGGGMGAVDTLGSISRHPVSPQVEQSPQSAPQSPQAHPTDQVAESIVRDLAASVGMDVESLIPQARQPAPVADQIASDMAPADTGLSDQTASPESRELELWLKSSDGSLTQDEQTELDEIRTQPQQEQTQDGIQQWPAPSSDVATQGNDVQGADVQRSDGDQRRDVGEGQRPDSNAETSLPSDGEALAVRDEGADSTPLTQEFQPVQEQSNGTQAAQAQQTETQGTEQQQVQADTASGISPWPDPSLPATQAPGSNDRQITEARTGKTSDQFEDVLGMVNQEQAAQELPSVRTGSNEKQLDIARAEQGSQSAPSRDYVRLQSFDHPSVGVLNNLRAQKDSAWSAVKKLKSQVSVGRNDLRVKLIQAESAHKDLVRQESSARESVEEAANAQGLTTYKPSRDESSGPMFSREESRTPPTTDLDGIRSTDISKANKLAMVFSALGKFEDAFQRETPVSTAMEDIAREVMPGAQVRKLNSELPQEWDLTGIPETWEIATKDSPNRVGRFMSDGKHVWIDVSRLLASKDMGSAMYAIAAAYAHNNGQVFIGDPAGLSPIAFFRRLENMISSAIKYGTTDHLMPHTAQMSPETYYAKEYPDFAKAVAGLGLQWKTGDFDSNLKQMLLTSYNAAKRFMPGIEDIEYDFTNGGFRRVSDNARIDREDIKNLPRKDVGEGPQASKRYYAGGATTARAILSQSVSRSQGAEVWPTVLAGMRTQLRGRRLDPSLNKIFYSKDAKAQEQIAREFFGNPNPKSTVEQVTKELAGEGSLGDNIQVIQSALDLPPDERRQVFKASSADIGLEAVFFPESGKTYIIADNIEPGKALAALMHDGGVHAGLHGMLGERGINSLASQIKDWSINSLGKEEGRIAKLALARIPESTSPNHKNEEAVAYFITEAVNAGHGDPKPTRSSAISRWFARLWKMVESAITKLGANPSSLTVDDVVALARGALERVKSGEIDPRRTGAKDSAPQASRSPNVTEKSVSVGVRTSPKREAKVATTPTIPSGDSSVAFDLADPTRWDKFVMNMQDKQINLKRVQQAISKTKTIQEQFDAYQKEELYHGRVAARAHKFLDAEMRPLLSEMQMGNISMDELDAYLWARHAKERNAQIRKINPEMEDGGSGLTDSQADDYFAGRDVIDSDNNVIIKGLSARHADRLSRLAKKIDSITAGTKQVLLQYGLETKETISAWEGAYQHYVPLQREDMDGGPSIGQGFSVKGSSSKRAMGSSRKVTNILANLAMQREAAITRGEKNRVALSLYGLAIQNKNPDLWEVDRAPAKRIINKSTGLVEDAVDTNYKSKDNVLVVRVGGEDRAVVFNERNERAMDMVAMLKNLDSSTVGEITNLVGHATRYFSSINTQYNPVFGLFNGLRDVQSATLNLSTTPLASKQLAVLRAIPGAMRAIWKIERGGKSGTEYDKIYEDMKMSGGTTGYREVFRMGNDRAKALQKEIDGASAGFSKKTFRSLLEVLDHYNTAIENGTRLAAYKVAISKGFSADKAASIAKNLTVNFNRKGKLAQQVGPWYAFFNAAVQGTARTHETLAGPTGKKILIGGVTLGIMQAILAMSGFDDDEWEAIPEFVKQRNYIIPLGNGDYVAFPMPLGFNVLPNIGRIFADIVSSKGKNAGTKIADLLSILLDNANPLGSSTFLQTLSPTVLDPIVALIENKNFAGRPIAREDFNPLRPTPGFKRAKDTSSHASRGLSKAINYATGGTDYTPGGWSPTPDQLDYIFGTLTGGVGREFNRVYSSIELQVKGEKVPLNKIPVYGKFVGTTRDDLSVSAKYWNNVKELAVVSNELNGRRMEGVSSEDYRKKHPEASLALKADNLEKYIAQIRAARHKAEFNEKLTEEERTAKLKLLDEKITRQMTTFNTMVAKAKKGFVAAESGEDGDDDE